MLKSARLLLILVAMAVVRPVTTLPAQDAVANQLMRFEDQWGAASLKRDGATIGRMLADDFTFIRPDGSSADKAKTVADVNGDTGQYVSGKNTDYKVKVYGNAAVITGLWTVTSKTGKGIVTRRIRWTDIWVRQGDGRWLCVAGQGAIIEK